MPATPIAEDSRPDPFSGALGDGRGSGRPREPLERFCKARDLKPDMLVDWQHDPYGHHPTAEFEYDVVESLQWLDDGRIMVHCTYVSPVVPPDHPVRVPNW